MQNENCLLERGALRFNSPLENPPARAYTLHSHLKESAMISICRSVVLSCVVVLAMAHAVYAQTAEQDVSKAEDARYDIMIRNDQVALDAILADEFVYHQPSGAIVPKAQYMANLKSGDVKINSAVRANVTIKVYGDTATAMGDTKVDVVLKGEQKKVHLRYLNVWLKRDGRWQLTARQSAYVPAPK